MGACAKGHCGVTPVTGHVLALEMKLSASETPAVIWTLMTWCSPPAVKPKAHTTTLPVASACNIAHQEIFNKTFRNSWSIKRYLLVELSLMIFCRLGCS